MIELVRTLQPELVTRLVQLDKEAFDEGGMNEWHLVPMIRHGRVYIYKRNKKVIGSIQYLLDWENPSKAYMYGVSIAQEFRGQGIGSELLIETLKTLFRENIKEVELTVDPNNARAVKIYESKLGFKVTDTRQNEYGEGENRLVMILSVADFANKEF